MSVRIVRRISAFVLFALATPSLLLAQPAATSLSELRLLVRSGDSVSVVDTAGNTVTGRIADLSRSSLRLLVEGETRDFAQDGIRLITQRRSDSLANGAIIGAAAGAGFGVAGLVVACHSGCSWEPYAIPTIAALYGAMGAGIGVGVDALIRGRKVIYSSAPTRQTTVRVSPTLRPDQKSVRVAIGF
jgi:hypothetical protein